MKKTGGILKKSKKAWFLVVMFALPVFLQACVSDGAITGAAKSVMNLTPAQVWIEKVIFNPSPDLNENAAVSVHLIIAYDSEPLGKLNDMTSQQYFEQEDQLRKDYPEKLQFFAWELAPGQKIDDAYIDLDKVTGVGGVFFARYTSPGKHRLGLAQQRIVKLNLSKLDFTMEKIK